ncbi:MAG: 23S rRNA (adenine(2503)-C(2))-methyltransferase RlmN [Desulfovermiculus sp.]
MTPKIHQQAKTSLFELSRTELAECMHSLGQPVFRTTQVWQWVWQKGCRNFNEMTNVSKDLRTSLEQAYSLELPSISALTTSQDGTIKGLLRLFDASHVEWVLIPERDHYTLCLSTQAGCPLACSFCSTGRMGFERNLTAGEILSQVLVAQETLKNSQTSWSLRNIVFMGMGEPLLNWPQVEKSLHVLRDPLGLGFSHRRVTVSSVGIPDVLEEFAHTGLASLAVSLHAPTQDLRQKIMPKAARLLPLPELVARLQDLPLKPRQRITIEYILLAGINDSLEQAKDLNRLLSGLKCKINLISFNPAPDLPYVAPDPEDVLRFERFLWSKGQTVTLRKSKGQDIQAACGQLRKTDEGQTHVPAGLERSDHVTT